MSCETVNALVSHSEDQWFESTLRCPSHSGVEMGIWLLLVVEKEMEPGVVLATSSSKCVNRSRKYGH